MGTTGDYKPFSHLRDGVYSGLDIELARLIALRLNLKLKFVPTTWASLVEDLESNRFDLALGGITRTLDRQTRANFSRPVFIIGKCALVRAGEAGRFATLQDIDKAGIRVGVNPGGTNERYVRENIRNATIVVVKDNLKIPTLVAENQLDVMLTDNVEALDASQNDPRLQAVSANSPWTNETLALLVARDDYAMVNWLNLFLEMSEADGTLNGLKKKHGLP